MNHLILSALACVLLASCDTDVHVPASGGDKTTIVNPPATEKKVETNTTIVTPPAEEKK